MSFVKFLLIVWEGTFRVTTFLLSVFRQPFIRSIRVRINNMVSMTWIRRYFQNDTTLSRNRFKVLKLKNSPTGLITSTEYILMANVSQTQDKLRVVEKSYVDVYEKWISFICPGKSVPAIRNHYHKLVFP